MIKLQNMKYEVVLKDETPRLKSTQFLGKSREQVRRALLPKLEGCLLADVHRCTKGRGEHNAAQHIQREHEM